MQWYNNEIKIKLVQIQLINAQQQTKYWYFSSVNQMWLFYLVL